VSGPAPIIKLNIGGFRYLTTEATLNSKGDNFFTGLLNNKIPSIRDEDGYYFVDRNGKYFEPILDYLRSGEFFIPEGMRKEKVLAEADFFLIEPIRQDYKRLKRALYDTDNVGEGVLLKKIYQQSQGFDGDDIDPDATSWKRLFSPVFPLLKFAARLGFPGFAVEIRGESDTGIQAYYDIYGSKAMPSGLIKLDIAPSLKITRELNTEKGRNALEEYLRSDEGFARVSTHYDTNRNSIVVSIGW